LYNNTTNIDLIDFSGDTTTENIKFIPSNIIEINDDILNKILETNPDEPQGEYKCVHDMLIKKRDYQYTIKK
jgi:hypothetical protein